MSVVYAVEDIITDKGFTIAKQGDKGKAIKGITPQEACNIGKVFCYFKEKKHGYWCDPSKIKFARGVDPNPYISEKIAFDQYADTPNLPTISECYEFNFGENLKFCRTARKLSQAALGVEMERHGLKIAQSTICYREQQKGCPSGKFLLAVAKALQIPPFALFVPLQECDKFSSVKRYLNCVSSAVAE